MSPKAMTDAWQLSSAPDETGDLGLNLLSLLLGTGFTLGLLLGIAHFEHAAPPRPPADLDDLRIAVLPVQPPPAPVAPTETTTEFTPVAGFVLAPSDSAVKIAVSPPELAAILPADLSRVPPPNAQFDLRLTDFKPKMSVLEETQHVYQRSEVDRPPAVLDRPSPQVPSRVRDNASVLRVTLLVVIETTGGVGNVRVTKTSGNEQFDALMATAIREWVFSPALKGGRKVRCLIEQGITVQWSAGSPFHA